MRRAILLVTVMATAVLFAFSGVVLAQQGENTTPAASEDSPSFKGQDGQRAATGQMIVKLAEGATEEDLEELNRRNNARTDKQLAPDAVPGLYRVILPRGLAVRDAVARYNGSGVIEYAEPDYIRYPATHPPDSPDDTDYSKLWGLHNTGQTGGTNDADVDAPEAWHLTTGNDSNPLIAVIDTGVDIAHPDLAGNIWTNTVEQQGTSGVDDDNNGKVDDINGWDEFNNDASLYDPNSDGKGDEHGTHVAGTIGGVGNNKTGVTGVNWQTDVAVCKFLGPDGGYTSDAIACVEYVAVKLGAKVSNNSWGGGGYSQALYDMIDAARQKGHIFVAAAGNGGWDGRGDDNDKWPSYPASYGDSVAVAKNTNPDKPGLDNVIAVAASDKYDKKASYSNYGNRSVHLGAPGSSIYSTLPSSKYGSYSGTSMATPHVAGTVGLIWAKNSGVSYTQVKSLLLSNVDKKSSLDKTVSDGRLNAYKAVNATPTP